MGDLLPHIVSGLREAWKQGYLSASQKLADYRIGGLVLGWEVTGLNDVAIAVRDLRATATTVCTPREGRGDCVKSREREAETERQE